MQIHSLNFEDFCEEEYTLLGIHTTLEDYKLAYLLNQKLKTQFTRAKYDLDFQNEKNNASFSVYNFENTKYDFDWYLIANSYIQQTSNTSNELFFNSEIKTYLIPEKKNVDFFIKMTGDANYSFIQNTINQIKSISQVITSYAVSTDNLKSKDYLIF